MVHQIEDEEIRVLTDPSEIQKLCKNLLESAVSEISLILSTTNALLRQHKIGIIDLIKIAANFEVQINLPKTCSIMIC